MKVRSVIVDTLQLEFMEGDVEKLSKLIEKIISAKRNPIVLIKDDGDELLRKIPKLGDCDLVFTKKSSIPYQGLLDGIHGAGTCTFYIPFDKPYGEEKTWLELEQAFLQLPYMNTIHRIVPREGFPWLIASAGVLYLKAQKSDYNLENDSHLNTLSPK